MCLKITWLHNQLLIRMFLLLFLLLLFFFVHFQWSRMECHLTHENLGNQNGSLGNDITRKTAFYSYWAYNIAHFIHVFIHLNHITNKLINICELLTREKKTQQHECNHILDWRMLYICNSFVYNEMCVLNVLSWMRCWIEVESKAWRYGCG